MRCWRVPLSNGSQASLGMLACWPLFADRNILAERSRGGGWKEAAIKCARSIVSWNARSLFGTSWSDPPALQAKRRALHRLIARHGIMCCQMRGGAV